MKGRRWMGRGILLGLLFLCDAAPTQAQAALAGVKGGITTSTATFDFYDGVSTSPTSGRRGGAAGVFARVPLVGRLALQLEVVRTRKGYTRTNPALDLDYVELPVLLRFSGSDRVAPFVQVGVAPAYELGCRVYYETIDGRQVGDCESVEPFGRSEATRQYDLGAVAGAGVAGRLRGVHWDVDLRYTHGLGDIRQAAERTRNRSAAATVSLGVPIF